MWQLAVAAITASSGFTREAVPKYSGEPEACTTSPPAKVHSWERSKVS